MSPATAIFSSGTQRKGVGVACGHGVQGGAGEVVGVVCGGSGRDGVGGGGEGDWEGGIRSC